MRRALLVTVGLLVGCSSSYSTGAPPDQPFNDLTTEQGQTACENLAAYLTALVPPEHAQHAACLGVAYGTTTDPATCEASVTACRAREFDNPFDFDCSNPFIDPTCGATVAQVEACITADLLAQQAWLGQIRSAGCSVAGNIPELTRLGTRPGAPSECTTLSTVCPTLARGFPPR